LRGGHRGSVAVKWEVVMIMALAHRERLEGLVRLLPDDAVPVAEKFVRWLIEEGADPLARLLARAPLDDEPVTREEEAAIREAEEDIAGGRVTPLEAVLRKHGMGGA